MLHNCSTQEDLCVIEASLDYIEFKARPAGGYRDPVSEDQKIISRF